jgi:hypothetical protein
MTPKNDDAKLKEGLRLKITKFFNLDQFVTKLIESERFLCYWVKSKSVILTSNNWDLKDANQEQKSKAKNSVGASL